MDTSSPGPLWPSKIVEKEERLMITDLLLNQTYYVRVLAFSDRGDGPPSQPIEVQLHQSSEFLNLFISFIGCFFIKMMNSC